MNSAKNRSSSLSLLQPTLSMELVCVRSHAYLATRLPTFLNLADRDHHQPPPAFPRACEPFSTTDLSVGLKSPATARFCHNVLPVRVMRPEFNAANWKACFVS